MAHLINPIEKSSFEETLPISDVISLLERAHKIIGACAIEFQHNLDGNEYTSYWGSSIKRKKVVLNFKEKQHPLLKEEKEEESFFEVINILATTERTIEALKAFEILFPDAKVQECHPSTSDGKDGNDIVLIDANNKVIVRCEVCDIISHNASQNGKEKSSLKKLDCEDHVPLDSIYRFIVTSAEFAKALCSNRREWNSKHYYYERIETPNTTVLLRVIAKAEN